MDLNLLSKQKEIKSTFNKWKKEILLYMVRILLSFGGASISFLLSVLPSPNENFFKEKKVYLNMNILKRRLLL